MEKLFNVVLVEPEIPSNTGNIGRSCVGLNSKLHLVKPLSFDLSDKRLKRAGLDYWPHLSYQVHESYEEFWNLQKPESFFFFSTKAKNDLYDVQFKKGSYLIFGKETKGLNEALLSEYPKQAIKIPMLGSIRSFNLANAVSMVLTEAYRQIK